MSPSHDTTGCRRKGAPCRHATCAGTTVRLATFRESYPAESDCLDKHPGQRPMEADVLEESPFSELECREIPPFQSFQHGLCVLGLLYTA